jgi:AcrR family transcriptional regulator
MPVPARPRQARAVETHNKLLDATIECLEERGYAGTSTTAICKAAGCSQGALFKHFAVKNALLAAAVQRLFGQLIADYRDAVQGIEPGLAGVRPALRALWHIFERPALRSVFELYIAAQTDDDLRTHLEPVMTAHRDNLHAVAAAMFPGGAAAPQFINAIDCVVNALQGMAIGLLAPAPDAVEAQLSYLENLACAELFS